MAERTPIVVLHGWSDAATSFVNLGEFLSRRLRRPVETVNLANWVSLDDDVTFGDLVHALNRAWADRGLPSTRRSVDVVTHSAGALVVRDWMTTHFTPTTVPIKRFLMLAPTNFGSPLAHKGRGFVGRIIKGWRTGLETGTQILKGLELASPYTWALADRDVFVSRADGWYGRDRVMATVLVGNRGYAGVRAAANEDGGDGTVRIATANLNAAMLTVDFSTTPTRPTYRLREPPASRHVAFTVLDGDNHGSIIMKEDGTPRDSEARDLLAGALSVTPGRWDAWRRRLARRRQRMLARAARRRHSYQNTVVCVQDDFGQFVEDYFLEFYSGDKDLSTFGRVFHESVIKTVHAYGENSAYRAVYTDVTTLHRRIDKSGDTLELCLLAYPILEGTAKVGYRTVSSDEIGSLRLSPDQVRAVFRPDRTLLLRIVIGRAVSDDIVEIKPVRRW